MAEKYFSGKNIFWEMGIYNHTVLSGIFCLQTPGSSESTLDMRWFWVNTLLLLWRGRCGAGGQPRVRPSARLSPTHSVPAAPVRSPPHVQ